MKHAARALVAAALAIAVAAPAAAAPEVRPIDRDGLSSLLRAQRGRVVVLNMWATWCEPCREEFPAGDDDAFINALDPAWSGALPATFLYDQAGRRVQTFSGTVTLKRLKRAVTPLLSKP